MGLKSLTLNGLKWSFADSFVNKAIQFIVGIILARLLSPEEFGLIGMITVFISLSEIIIDSGLSQSLIRKKVCTQIDYNTMFYINITLGILMFAILFLVSPHIAIFYKKPELETILKTMSIVLVINSIGLVEQTQLIREINFKVITKISLISSICSGLVGIVLALLGFSYWSLVWKSIIQQTVRIILLYCVSHWHPKLQFSINSFKEMFGFGSRLLISQFIGKMYINLYYFLIGKFFSANILGLYTKAEQLKNFPTDNLIFTVQRVTYPVLSKLNDQPEKQIVAYRKLIKNLFFLTSILIIGMISFAYEIVYILLGDRWIGVVFYLQILSFSAIPMPLIYINMNILKAKNRADLYLRLEMAKKIIFIPILYFGVIKGIRTFLFIIVVISFLDYLINTVVIAPLINYGLWNQIKDVMPTIFYCIFIISLIFLISILIKGYFVIAAILKFIVYMCSILFIGEVFHIQEYVEIKSIINIMIRHLYNTLHDKLLYISKNNT